MTVKPSTPIRFRLDERKAAQAAAFLIKKHGVPLSFFRLIKLLYLADRKALLEMGAPLTGDIMVSMDKGPVLSTIYNIIKGRQSSAEWSNLINPPIDHLLSLRNNDPPTDELSEYDIEILECVYKRYAYAQNLVQYLHMLGEWKNPRGSVLPINPQDILVAEHRSAEEIKRVAEDAEDLWVLDSVIHADS